jgi:hypothetical protein
MLIAPSINACSTFDVPVSVKIHVEVFGVVTSCGVATPEDLDMKSNAIGVCINRTYTLK